MNENYQSEASHLDDSRCDEFKDRINVLSDRLGGSSQLARLSGVSESVVRKWKAGTSEPTLSRLKAIAEAGGVSVQWLATGEESQATASMRSFSGSCFPATLTTKLKSLFLKTDRLLLLISIVNGAAGAM